MNLAVCLLVLSPFLPGPSIRLSNLIYNGGQLLGLFGLIVIPFGLFWTVKEIIRRKTDDEHHINTGAIILLTLPLTFFLTSMYISGVVRNFSRTFAINRTAELILSIEKFKEKNGAYPDSLSALSPSFIPNIPSPFIMGIDEFHYVRKGSSYNILFYQNVVLNFNFEVVIFDPLDSHKLEGESTALYETGNAHWKYYIFD
jgi:hypothetical protein